MREACLLNAIRLISRMAPILEENVLPMKKHWKSKKLVSIHNLQPSCNQSIWGEPLMQTAVCC